MMSFWYYNVHSPHIGRKDYVERFEAKGMTGKTAQYAAMVKSVDDSVGRVRHALAEKGVEQETSLIFLTDQGGYFENPPFHGGKTIRDNTTIDRGTPIFGYRAYEVLYASVRKGDWKLLAYRSGILKLYNIASDKEETNELAASRPDMVAELKARLIAWKGK